MKILIRKDSSLTSWQWYGLSRNPSPFIGACGPKTHYRKTVHILMHSTSSLFFFLQYPWKHTCTPPLLTGVSVHLARIFPHERYIPAHPVISLSQRYVCTSGTQAALPNTVRANNCHFVMQTTRSVFCNPDLLRSFVATDTYEVCPESIQPFWISREPVAWLWCNVAASQRRPYCASVNSHSPVGLVSRQWDAVDWACVLRDRRIHKSPPFQRRFYLWEKPEFAGSQI